LYNLQFSFPQLNILCMERYINLDLESPTKALIFLYIMIIKQIHNFVEYVI
jgi:hypothetical protein